MKINKTLTALIAGASIGMSGQAYSATSAGTSAGTDITNNVSLAYTVGGVSQDNETASVMFDVDNKVDFTVIQQETTTQGIVPNGPLNGATYSVKFLVSNNGNSSQDYHLAAVDAGSVSVNVSNLANDTNPVTDNAETGVTFKIYIDDGTDTANYNPADDTDTHINALSDGQDATVWVVIDENSKVDSTLADLAIAAVQLTVTTHDDDSASTLGSESVKHNTAAYAQNTVQNVFADTHASNGTDYDGKQIDYAAFEVATAKLDVTKTVRVLSDPLCGNSFVDYLVTACTPATYIPKAIPGARVEFTISIENTGSIISDVYTISDDLTNVAATGIKLDDAAGSPVEVTDDASAVSAVVNNAGTYGNVLITDIPALAAGATEEVKITAYVD